MDATVKGIKEFFGYKTLTEFSNDWKQMPQADRDQIKQGLADDTLTY